MGQKRRVIIDGIKIHHSSDGHESTSNRRLWNIVFMWPVHANNEAILLKHSFSNFHSIIEPNNMGVYGTTKAPDIHLFSAAINEKGVLKYTPFRGTGGGGLRITAPAHIPNGIEKLFSAFDGYRVGKLLITRVQSIDCGCSQLTRITVNFGFDLNIYTWHTRHRRVSRIFRNPLSCLWLEHAVGYIARD